MQFFLLLSLLLQVNGMFVERTFPQGRLRGGLMTTRLGRPFHAFWKIPYAKPPVGNLRFRMPQKAGKWEGVRDASKDDGTMCPQRNVGLTPYDLFVLKGTEDCLYLSVFAPMMENVMEKRLPVLVWIHGGSFEAGSYSQFPPNHLMDKEIVMVSINYRLGSLGFLSMEDKDLPGNWGLKDQSLALRWVRENIHYFGGNPEMITIFGESAGGASVHYHMVSPMSRGLFHRAISNSGSIFSAWGFRSPGENRNNTIKMAKIQQCPTEPTRALARCMRKKSMRDIIEQHTIFFEWYLDPMTPFKPVVEHSTPKSEAFLPEHPEREMAAGNIAQVPWLTGINNAEGALRVSGIYNSTERVKELNEDFYNIAPMSLFYRQKTRDVNSITKVIRQFYYGNKPVDFTTVRQTTDLWTDCWFFAGQDHAVRLHLAHVQAPVYMYYFTYRGSHSYSTMYGNPHINFGTCHVDDCIYLFPKGHIFAGKPYTAYDKKYIDLFVQLWTDFAIHGDPTPPGNPLHVHWEPVKTDRLEHLHIGYGLPHMRTDLLHDRREFWRTLGFY